ncbi:LysR family transcriptional regulator [Rhodocytophaga rosea]|uniref:LysR family transcriptional regulator n=2 Tax=Rhodocytophaga rosea TaxID=2704465 RepID=A0A6C0GVG9_9BACT|nr:LysR family transcriptional regulator [Rhodocytophaga rosea]
MQQLPRKKIEVKGRIWLEAEGIKFIGPGRIQLLELIKEHGSISQAAKIMGMSYRKAWILIDEMNTVSSTPVVLTQKGGQSGGGAQVTQTGDFLISYFKTLYDRYNSFLAQEEKAFAKLMDNFQDK